MSKHIRQGDKVIAIAGNHKGRVGKVISRQGERVVVEGLNVRKKHAKRTQQAAGSIIEKEMPLHISNLKVVSDDGKPVKLRVRFNAENEKELYYTNGKQHVHYRQVKTSK
ncbi:MAG: 50S ribosomal protein L24 [Chlamydiales bacterium]|nr:50S ribosomal protein L24 [Chlamydiales bacterium]